MTTADDPPITPTEKRTLEDLDGTPHARLFEGEPKTIRLTLAEGDGVAAHQHPDREIVLHVLEGRLAVTLGDESHELDAGDVVRFDGAQDIAPKALTDATALLVLAKRADGPNTD
ncbi:cupin domain-containing protein [Halopiger djelfimassiliensis]|uniref:cupin domain-containing protein n=1 Tax=Halopiger djelfimassiliensis TaxID=1293047 RepID=UPI0006782376|nr:cupin domain-containing protein [Halopiger djelfimassiliensis]